MKDSCNPHCFWRGEGENIQQLPSSYVELHEGRTNSSYTRISRVIMSHTEIIASIEYKAQIYRVKTRLDSLKTGLTRGNVTGGVIVRLRSYVLSEMTPKFSHSPIPLTTSASRTISWPLSITTAKIKFSFRSKFGSRGRTTNDRIFCMTWSGCKYETSRRVGNWSRDFTLSFHLLTF